ncbi:LOW QUALITY PROTEIN: hypothetical protein PHPALM_32144 [Phytophthora palmivora]|uniref:Uncharacterized protein n=1 Tax=Phytophthora palmivora TaxID=4796 RepID=A0A2P4X0V3_9STRA|nr:LOW QUALITY PROTEIN: hypothetical protein PHPALM_32144 [Phytophthora palmivora]
MEYRGDQLYPVKKKVRVRLQGVLAMRPHFGISSPYALDLKVMLRGLPVRKPPGRPRKKTRCLDRNGHEEVNIRWKYTVDALIKYLVDKPASAINWCILKPQNSIDGDGEQTEFNHVGKINPPFMRGGKRYWNIQYEDLQGVSAMNVEELARTIH